ncbi:MAG TPA: 30S ribosomal protein S5 [Acidobacteriota bacterium]|jgi:small subunit ribosomal protein S5|nr:30S ribosomal protein S5 [Acidobacteriota bacterium]HNT16465.1 30S ribosomal protein S5 [Acidobacteriota bacterium]HPA27285.1 30S ribosomal protein S5 [Acidobacteriota bacterium]HQO20547.1 30S ribosomal protein S5 [Acidobacteriota bacterium]HQQ47067.1 30S ribosomal protein S5 [Acidobacteriota bacterium]
MVDRVEGQEFEITEQVVNVRRVTKVVKGGKNFSFSALVVAGDGHGRVGFGLGKAREVPLAVSKAFEKAKKSMVFVSICETSIPHPIIGHFGSSQVVMRPASKGTGVIAGGAVRSVMEAAGIRDILTKCLGTNNPQNVVKATFNGLKRLQNVENIAGKRGKTIEEITR